MATQVEWKTGSRFSPHARLLENRLAYQVLETIYQSIPSDTRGGPALDDPLHASPELHDYQNWLHARLPESGLAKGLAAGPDFLPDIIAELPQPWQVIARLAAPRNYRQLTVQVLRNLAWYLGDGSLPITPTHMARAAFWPACLMTGLMLSALTCSTELGIQDWPMLLMCGIAMLLGMFVLIWCHARDAGGRFSANCAELYAYLLEAYAEPEACAENRVQSLLIELGRDTDNSNAALRRRAGKGAGMGNLS